MRCFLITLLIVLVSSAAPCGESLTLAFTQTEIPRPEGRAIEGELPRPLLLVQLHRLTKGNSCILISKLKVQCMKTPV